MGNQPQLLDAINSLIEAINRQGLQFVGRRMIEAFGGLGIGLVAGYILRAYFVDVLSLSGIAASIAYVVFLVLLPLGAFAGVVRWQQRQIDGLRAMREYGQLVQKLHAVKQQLEGGGVSRQGTLTGVHGILVEHREYITIAAIPIPPIFLPDLVGRD